jgi:competence protein ComEC
MFLSKITTIINKEKEEIWSWTPIFLGIGVVLSLLFFHNQQIIFFASSLLIAAILLFYFDRFSYRSFIYALLGLLIFGFLWTVFYQKIFISDKELNGKIYVDVKGKVLEIRAFENPVNHKKGFNLLIENPVLYKAEFRKNEKNLEKPIKKKKKKLAKKAKKKPEKKEKKMTKKFLKLLDKCEGEESCIKDVNKAFLDHEAEKKARREEKKQAKLAQLKSICEANQESKDALKEVNNLNCQKKKTKKPSKKRKISEKQIEKNFLNLADYQEIDREFLSYKSNYQQVNWQKKADRYLFPNPPQKISILIYSNELLNKGDLIFVRATLDAPPKKEFIGDYDYSFDAAYKKIGGYGYGFGKMVILRKEQNSSFKEFIDDLRDKIATKITDEIKGDEGAITKALLVGTPQSLISKEAMLQIRNSGLAHLLSISGLHMAIAASIFFISIRFLLSCNQYLTLHFNIKKIAALMAIFSSYFYLELADSPIPAVRSFIMVAAVLLAVFFDLKASAKRSLALAAFILILANPYNVFAVSFQLSFIAILSLLWSHEVISKLKKNLNYDSLLQKFLWYFLEIILASIVVQIATMPFLIYHFRNFSTYGLFSNILAIPLTTFITMPLGFLSILLMPFGLEKFTLFLTGISVSWLLEIAQFFASIKYSYFITVEMPKFAFIFAILSLFMMFLLRSGLKWLGLLIFILSFFSLNFVKKPNLLFDSKQKIFAIYNQKDGLIFSKDIRSKKIRESWMNFMNEDNYKNFAQFSEKDLSEKGIRCDKKKCEINDKEKILILLEREKISEICNKNFDVIVNMTRKYKLPQCFSDEKIKIENIDFLKKGGHYFYFKELSRIRNSLKDDIFVKTAR